MLEKRTMPQAQIVAGPRVVTIEAAGGLAGYWREMWAYRELMYFLALRDILVRYKQTAMGVSWSVVRPVLTMLALTWVFSRSARLETPSPQIPYSLWVFAATLAWQFFGDGLTAASNSLVSNTNMVSKVYFPRMLLPASRIIVSFVDFTLAFVVLLLVMAGYHFTRYHFSPDWRMLFIPVFLLMAFALTLGSGLLVAALNVKYRDFVYVVPFIITFGLYVSPVGLGSAELAHNDATVRFFLSFNPMVGVIDGFRWAVFGPAQAPLFWPGMIASLFSILVFMWIGVSYFRRTEDTFADVI